ncbi:MAG: hypothetical protein ACHP8B_04125 [Terriglobales bacterium]
MKAKSAKQASDAQKKRRATIQRKKAVARLSKWVQENTPVEFIECSSGLRHFGSIRHLQEEDFMFVAEDGAHALLFPITWNDAEAPEKIIFETVHVGSEGHGFTLSAVAQPNTNSDALKAVLCQLEGWQASESLLHVYMGDGFCTGHFPGKVEGFTNSESGAKGCQIKHWKSDLWFHVDLSMGRCQLTQDAGRASVSIFPRGKRAFIAISETELTVIEFLSRFPVHNDLAN